jgi:chemotaxis protein MotB
MAGRRRRKHEEHEEHENHERWMVSYADMLTLLLALFIVLYAMSQVDQTKYEALRSSLSVGFGGEPTVMTGSSGVLQDEQKAVAPDLYSGAFIGGPVEGGTTEKSAEEKRQLAAAKVEANTLKGVEARLLKALRKEGLRRDVRTVIDERGLVVSLVSRHVVFQPDVATLSRRGQRVVDTLAPVLGGIPNALRMDGHTNQEPVRPRLFATDWDLSAARAVTVLRRLNELHGLPQSRLSASAFGHVKPLIDPSLPGSQDINKRVDIVVLPGTDAMSSQLIDDVINARSGAHKGVEG